MDSVLEEVSKASGCYCIQVRGGEVVWHSGNFCDFGIEKPQDAMLIFGAHPGEGWDVHSSKEGDTITLVISHSLPEGVLVCDMAGRYIYCNQTACNMTGYSENELLRKSLGDLSSSFIKSHLVSYLRELRRGTARSKVWEIRCKDGKLMPVEIASRKIFFKGRKAVQVRLRKIGSSSAQDFVLEGILKSMADMVFVIDKDERLTYCHSQDPSHSFVRDFVGKKIADVIPRDIVARYRKHKKGGQYEFSMALDGVERWYSSRVSPLGGSYSGSVVVVRETTEQVRSRHELSSSREYLDRIIDALADPVFVKDQDHKWILLNDEFCRFMGYKREELLGKSDFDFFPKEQAVIFWEKDRQTLDSGKETINEEEFTDKAGFTHTIITKKTVQHDSAGRKILVGIIRDITELKRIQSNLSRSKEFSEKIIDTAGSLIVGLDTRGRIRIFNRQAEEITGFSRESVIGKDWFARFLPSEDREKTRRFFSEMILSKRNTTRVGAIMTKSRERRSMLWSNTVVEGNEDIMIMGIGQDITEQENIEVELQRLNQELRKRVHELERFQRLTVGRELRMIELKKQIKRLKEGSGFES